MYFDVNKYLLLFIGWLIQTSYQLECLQCTSSIRRVAQNWDHSCLDGTLTPLLCKEPINGSETPYIQCVSALYRLSPRGSSGVVIHRSCSSSDVVVNECDPPEISRNFDRITEFYCSRTCSDDGCNRHSVKDISSDANQLFKRKFLLLCYIFILFSMQFVFLIKIY